MKILNAELEFNFNDADDMEKLEKAVDETQKALDGLNTDNMKASEAIRTTCKVIFDCFNIIFGEGTDKLIFGNKTNLNVCLEAFRALKEAKIEQEAELEEAMQVLSNDNYSPNRASRRKAKKK